MDFYFTPEDEAFRQEIVDFVSKEVPRDWRTARIDTEEPEWRDAIRQFKKKLAQKGWLTMAWPKEYGGGGASHMQQMVFNEEMAYRRLPAGDMGISMVGPVLMLNGTEEQKKFFLPRISQAEISWAQGYSEPDAGSDLASLQTRAVEDGDDFVVNGAKIWNGAHGGADWMFMLVRTDPDAPKHRGISFLLTEMDVPGITVEKIPMMWKGFRSLVTFESVRVPKSNLLGEQNRGWYVGAALLDFERSGVGRSAGARRLLEEIVELAKKTKWNGGTVAANPIIRHRLANAAVEIEACRLISYHVAWMQSKGLIPNKEASLNKLIGSEMSMRLYSVGMEIMGLYGQLDPDSKYALLQGRLEQGFLSARGGMMAGGSSEIQRNVIATRGLGLPRG